MAREAHEYTARLIWDGNTGAGTATYAGYGREYRFLVDGKPELEGTADPKFKGDPSRHNPEEHFLAAISGCHMLSYLALCARNNIRVLAYEDDVRGTLKFDSRGGGKFEEVVLHPAVTIAEGDDAELAESLHEQAHELCFIAASCSVPIRHEARVGSATAA
ncbi:MAG TPA: OsmC family protein [Gemmatimonadaceae bacterium]|jgi:Predicted redox protein, regulator of disulfide bond formation